jgi:hypothetical protein
MYVCMYICSRLYLVGKLQLEYHDLFACNVSFHLSAYVKATKQPTYVQLRIQSYDFELPTYNASVVNIYNATSSLVRFEAEIFPYRN